VTQETLDQALADFEASPATGRWPRIDKTVLLGDVRATVADPEHQVSQAKAQLCGPTSVVLELVRQQPDRYVQVCRELFETGSFATATKQVRASDQLRAQPAGQGMSAADWLVVATMRDAENAVFKVDGTATGILAGLQGLTTPWELQGWTREVLGKHDTTVSLAFLWGERDALIRADRVWQAGGVAFLLVHTDLLRRPEQSTHPLVPDHWVVHRGGLAFSDDRVRFSVWSWARRYDVDVPLGRFEDVVFGAVTGL
jgi:hypothetical protein